MGLTMPCEHASDAGHLICSICGDWQIVVEAV